MTEETNAVPQWVHASLFEDVLHQTVGDFKKITSFKVFNALKPGENYATVMLKVQIELILADDSKAEQTFMLKVSHDNKVHHDLLSSWNLFGREAGMYRDVVPELEQMYREKGLDIRFGAQAYLLPVQEEYILLEDLGRKGFRNAKRQDCLDIRHMQSVLRKLAQWHAASAVRIQQKGIYDEQYLYGILNSKNGRTKFDKLFANCFKYAIRAVKELSHFEEFKDQIVAAYAHTSEMAFDPQLETLQDFKVLNHGDCWCNNIMFQYNESDGSLKDTYFVDLQMPRYGSPAQDLWYFILSSAKLDLKINHFDEMICYYHKNLIEHLKILDYEGSPPALRELHVSLLNHRFWAPLTIGSVMAGVLCDPTDDASMDNIAGEENADNEFLSKLFLNQRYMEHIEKLLPRLYHKGVFEL